MADFASKYAFAFEDSSSSDDENEDVSTTAPV